ncbi:hypothetical protein LCGC14_1610450, partial [marine sediment metagenome]
MPVLSELATMTEVAQGTSLARFGHGELLIMWGENAEHQKYDRRLDIELGQIVGRSPCLVAAPPNDPPEWRGFLKKYGAPIRNERWYGSSFVSRHDWAPWTDEYRLLINSLWKARVVSVVSPAPIKLGHNSIVYHVPVPARNAFNAISLLESSQAFKDSELIILSCGPTGTVLADRLARKGIWAVD